MYRINPCCYYDCVLCGAFQKSSRFLYTGQYEFSIYCYKLKFVIHTIFYYFPKNFILRNLFLRDEMPVKIIFASRFSVNATILLSNFLRCSDRFFLIQASKTSIFVFTRLLTDLDQTDNNVLQFFYTGILFVTTFLNHSNVFSIIILFSR